MKKKVAIFSTGWPSEILSHYVQGLRDGLEKESVDLYFFINHATFDNTASYFQGEINIFNLPRMEDFDAALVFANGIDFPEILQKLNERFDAAKIPVIYTGKDYPQYYFVGSDNYVGTKALCEHLITHHGAKDLRFLAGSKDNMDSNTRLQAYLDSLIEHDLPIDANNITYTNWEPQRAAFYVKHLLSTENKLPDAILCANDTLAMITCSELRAHGYYVPKDILVTGFDNDYFGQVFDPSISSVDQRFDLIGAKCAEILVRVFQGLSCERTHTIACEYVPSESCGCIAAKDFNAIRREIGRNKFLDNIDASSFDLEMSQIERSVMQGKTYNDLKNRFEFVLKDHSRYEGPSFSIVLDPMFERTISDQEKHLHMEGYSDYMDVIFSKDQDVIQNYPSFESRKIVPMSSAPTENHQYTVVPLHEEEGCLGYLIFDDSFKKIKNSRFLRTYSERMSILLSKYLRDRRVDVLYYRLLQLTETDALTRVKNRTAFETREEKLQNDIQSSNCSPFALAVFDVNNLKQINDNLGHEAGDDYIINSCHLICQIFKKSAVYRIGGDEFVAVLENEDYEMRDQLMEEIFDKVKALKTDPYLEPTERVSIAGGLAAFDPQSDFSVTNVFKKADARMYEKKAKMKKEK